MFDSKEIARRAVLRAEEIKAERRKRAQNVIGLCSTASAMVIAILFIAVFPFDIATGDGSPDEHYISFEDDIFEDDHYISFEDDIFDNQIPLAAFMPDDYMLGDNFTFIMPSGDSIDSAADFESELFIINRAANGYCFTFEITLETTGKILYQSDFIASSGGLEHIILSGPLEAGGHTAALTVYIYESESEPYISSSKLEITIFAN